MLTVLPLTPLYRSYVADPRRPRFSIMYMKLLRTDLEDGGKTRVGVTMGGRYSFLRIHPEGDEDLGWELDFHLGAHFQFDAGNSVDSVGWDGFYGFGVNWKPLRWLAFRFSANHDSSHLGDELIENTRRERITYTREELAVGVSWQPRDELRLYGELGWAYSQGNSELQRPWRVQTGLEYESPPLLLGELGRLYAALDLVFFEENKWRPSMTAQAGLCLHVESIGRECRLGFQAYSGRCHLGEFFQYDERYIAIGVWLDL